MSDEEWAEVFASFKDLGSLSNAEIGRAINVGEFIVAKARRRLGLSRRKKKELRLVTSADEIEAAIERAHVRERHLQWAEYDARKRGQYAAAE